MNNGAFGENFPYSNFHDLNMDWIIKIAKDFLDQYSHIQETIANGEEALSNLTTEGLEALQNKADALEALLQEWYNSHSEDIADALADAIADFQTVYNTAVTNFNAEATQQALEVLASIPLDYSALSETVQELNANNELNAFTKTSGTQSGIAFDWSGNYCRVHGTASALTFNNIFNSVNSLPAGLSRGSRFYAGALDASQCGLEIYNVDANQQVRQIFFSMNTYPTDYITVPDDAVGMIVRIRVNSGTTLDETIYPYLSITPPQFVLEERTFKNWAYGDCVFVKATNIDQARQTEINALLTQYKNVVLLAGTFYINGSIVIPEGATLSGIGVATHILANSTNVVSITLSNNATVKNLWLDGGGSDRPSNIGTRYGIYVNELPQTVWIENCKISGFDRFGIFVGAKGTGTYPQFINNCYIELCYYALCIQNSDYVQVSNVTCRNNFCGVFENGGVTTYTSCGFDSNTNGILIIPTYDNNGHGSFIGCSICHNSADGIILENVTNGEIFADCQIHFNTIGIKGTSKGVQFISCQMGNGVSITYTSNKKNFFNHCLFWINPSITDTGSGTLVFHECYNIQTGDQITH